MSVSRSNQIARKGTRKLEKEAHFQGAVSADNGHHLKRTGKRAHSAADIVELVRAALVARVGTSRIASPRGCNDAVWSNTARWDR